MSFNQMLGCNGGGCASVSVFSFSLSVVICNFLVFLPQHTYILNIMKGEHSYITKTF